MIRPVSSVFVNPVFQKPHGTPPVYPLEFLQNKDVFFSEQSYRAQLAHFLSQKPNKPLMFSYVQQDQKTLWDRLLPVTQRDILLITPLLDRTEEQAHPESSKTPEEPEPSSDSTDASALPTETEESHSAEEASDKSEPEQSKPVATENPFASSPDLVNVAHALLKTGNPFAMEKADSIRQPAAVSGKEPTQKPDEDVPVKIQLLSGQLVKPEFFFQLEQAFQQAEAKREVPHWVQQTANNEIQVLPAGKNPMQLGFQKFAHPWLGMFYRLIAKIAVPLLGLKVQENKLEFPNGVALSLDPESWRDTEGKPARLYETMRLPNGTWFQLTGQQMEETIAFNNQKQLRNAIETRIHQLEASGKIRELSESKIA